MCFAPDALPPEFPQATPSDTGRAVTLTSADGATFATHVATPATPTGAGVVVLPDVRGLFGFYERLAEQFAALGIDAIAVDYFGRTAQPPPRGEDFDFRSHVDRTHHDEVAEDVAAAIHWLRDTGRVRAVFTVGFCFGGAQSFLQAARGHGLAGVIGFYGFPRSHRPNLPSPTDLVPSFECPVLGLFGGADQAIPSDVVEEFDHTLTDAGVEHIIHTYPGAPHSFFDRTSHEHQAACRDAWRRMRDFIASHTASLAS